MRETRTPLTAGRFIQMIQEAAERGGRNLDDCYVYISANCGNNEYDYEEEIDFKVDKLFMQIVLHEEDDLPYLD